MVKMKFPILNNYQYDKVVGVMDDDKIQLNEGINLKHYNISIGYSYTKITNGIIDPSSLKVVCISLVPKPFELEVKKEYNLIKILKVFFLRGKICLRKFIKGLKIY